MDIYAVTNAAGEVLSKSEVNEILEDIGISYEAVKSEDQTKIQADATENRIDLNRVQEKADKMGQDKISGANDTAKDDYNKQLISYGVPQDVISKGQSAIEAYAVQNNISLPQQTNGLQFNFKF